MVEKVDGLVLQVIAASMACVLQTYLLKDLNVLDLQTMVYKCALLLREAFLKSNLNIIVQ
jgi:hypothetical protein